MAVHRIVGSWDRRHRPTRHNFTRCCNHFARLAPQNFSARDAFLAPMLPVLLTLLAALWMAIAWITQVTIPFGPERQADHRGVRIGHLPTRTTGHP